MDMKTRTSWKTIAKRLLVVALVLSLAIPLVPQTMVVSASAVTQAEIDELKDNASDLREQQKELQNQLAAIKEADQCHPGRDQHHPDPNLQVRRAHCPEAGGAGRGGGEGAGPV